jgi:hypothetical protein
MGLLEIAAIVSVVSVFVALVAWLVRLKTRQESHEEGCEKRYAGIEKQHEQLVKVSDQRHQENLSRLDRMDEKLDVLLMRLR